MGARSAALAGLCAGLALSPVVAVPAALAAGAGAGLGTLGLACRPPRDSCAAAGLACPATIALAAALLGLAIGAARMAAIDAGGLDAVPGRELVAVGFVAAVPDRLDGEVRVRLETPDGVLLAVAREPVADLEVGSAVRVSGVARRARPWESRRGIGTVLDARSLEVVGGRRGGLAGLLDGLRARAESALGRGTREPAAALLRGFVLGQDDRIDAGTVQSFKRSGLAHLLAVSGQNVALLAVLATVALAALGVPLRARLAWIGVAIAVYVPVAGAGPSIQRAGVMGAAAIAATLAGRPRSRWYALMLAAVVTLALDPRASADVGWQLSFAAVAGILLAAGPIAGALGRRRGGWRRALAEGAAMTVAATLATAPLMAHHFGALSIVALPANLVALPAVAPVMWLGMASAALGQVPGIPVEPLTWLAGLLAGYIAAVADLFSTPSWAQAEVHLGAPALLAITGALAATLAVSLRWGGRRRGLRPAVAGPPLAIAGALVALAAGLPSPPPAPADDAGLRLTALDVGQGEAILLEPRGAEPILVDAGAAEADVAGQLERRGIERLGALVITHPQADHDGGAAAILDRIAVGRLLYARARPTTLAAARGAGTRPRRLARGDRLRAGALRADVLWPPGERLGAAAAGADPNLLSLVLLVHWRGFEALLTGDAEHEATAYDPGRVDVLKVAHHGSADAGLDGLLERADPGLALISVGDPNPFGHPAPETLATLAEHGVTVARTDERGATTVEVRGGRWTLR